MTCNPEQQEELSTNGSYPSGHTAIGWATALVWQKSILTGRMRF